jgi:hypothetical protein
MNNIFVTKIKGYLVKAKVEVEVKVEMKIQVKLKAEIMVLFFAMRLASF